MKTTNFGMVALTLLGASALTSYAQSLDLNISPLSGSQIVFDGSSFNFSPASPSTSLGPPNGPVPDQWFVSSEGGSASTGSAVNLDGAFAGGPFNYGSININGLTQSATVLNPGTLYIADGIGYLQGAVNFIDVSTYGQVGGVINLNVVINLMDVAYTGVNPDLQFLTAHQPGTVDLSFQFAAGQGLNLTQLSDGNVHSTSYSGSISVVPVPEPSSLAMSALGGLGALGFAFRKRFNF